VKVASLEALVVSLEALVGSLVREDSLELVLVGSLVRVDSAARVDSLVRVGLAAVLPLVGAVVPSLQVPR